MYDLSCQEAQTSSVAVTGTLSISGTPAYGLFDSGESYLFIIPYFAEHVELVVYLLA